MTPDKFTTDRKLFKDLLFCNNLDDMRLLKERLLNAVLNAKAEEQVGAVLHERTEKRITYRNGYRNRDLNTRDGTLHLRVPKLRNGTFSTQLFARYQRSERALMLAMIGDGNSRGLDKKSSKDHRRALWDSVFSSDGIQLVQGSG